MLAFRSGLPAGFSNSPQVSPTARGDLHREIDIPAPSRRHVVLVMSQSLKRQATALPHAAGSRWQVCPFQSFLCTRSRSALARTNIATFVLLMRSASSSEDELDKLTRSFEEQASQDLQHVAEASRKAKVHGNKQKSMKEARETGLQEPISEQSKCECRSSVVLASDNAHRV